MSNGYPKLNFLKNSKFSDPSTLLITVKDDPYWPKEIGYLDVNVLKPSTFPSVGADAAMESFP